MAQQIIITKDNYGIDVLCVFLDNKKKPIDITGRSVEVVIVNPEDTIIDTVQATIINAVSGYASIILDKEHTEEIGLHKTFWTVLDASGRVTAQNDIYYYVKDKNGGVDDEEDDLELDEESVLNKFDELDKSIEEINKTIEDIKEINVNKEILEARGDYTKLCDRLNSYDSSIEDVNEHLETIMYKLDYNVTDFGVVGDGITDYTDKINMAIETISQNGGGNLKFPRGNYLIRTTDPNPNKINHDYGNFEGGIHLKDNVSIIGDNAILTTKKNNNKYQCMIVVREVKNCVIDGFKLIGDLNSHIDLETEWGHGIFIAHSVNVNVINCNISNTMGDGVYIGIQYHNTSETNTINVSIDKCIISNVSRNGISLCSGDGVVIRDCIIKNISRKDPQSGIDIEPEGYGFIDPLVKNVLIDNVSIYDCGNVGIVTYLKEPQQTYENINIQNIYVEGCKRGFHNIAVDGYGNEGAKGGNINYINCHSNLAKENGFLIEENTINCPTILLIDCKVSNCNTENHNNINGSAFYVNKKSPYVISPGNVNIINPYVEDNRETTTIYSPFAFFSEVKRIKTPINFTIENPLRIDSKNTIQDGGIEGVNVLNDNKALMVDMGDKAYRRLLFDGHTVVNSAWSSSGLDINVPHYDWIQEGAIIDILNGGENKTITIDCSGEVGSLMRIYPFTKRYIRTSECGARLTIQKFGGIFTVKSMIGNWVENDS